MESYERQTVCAKPGDDDVSFDVDGLRLDNIVRYEREVIVTLSDGFGWWRNPSGEVVTFAPGSEDERVRRVEVRYDFAGMPEDVFAMVNDTLERWRSQEVLLRLVCAPERVSTLSRDVNDWLPMGKSHG